MCEFCEAKIKELEGYGKLGATAAVESFLCALMERDYEKAASSAARVLMLTSTLCLMKDASIPPTPDETISKCVEILQHEVDLLSSAIGGI